MEKVKIVNDGKRIRLFFHYNEALIEIMREHRGWWIKKDKCWQFPAFKYKELYAELKSKMYEVRVERV